MAINPNDYDFHGYVTKANILCSDGRTIMPGAFAHHDGQTVPLVWNHQHDDPYDVLGHVLLESKADGVYGYGKFNETEQGQNAKKLVENKDITALSIYANKLQHNSSRGVTHGMIREVSLVLAGANIGACIDTVIKHGEACDDEGIIYHGMENSVSIEKLEHAETEEDDESMAEIFDRAMNKLDEKEQNVVYSVIGEALEHSEESEEDADETVEHSEEETVEDVINSMTEKQKTVMYALVDEALNHDGMEEDPDSETEETEEETEEESEETKTETENNEEEIIMKHNVFEKDENKKDNVLCHADQEKIISMAKQSNVGSFKQALKLYAEETGAIQHSEDGVGIFENYGVLFPELELLKKGEPETLYANDQSWVTPALAKIHKSPFSRIRTRHADARTAELKAKGYQKKGDEKTIMGQIKMINRETTPQTIYIKDALHRDDVIDITDFSIVEYQWKQMRVVLNETMVLAAMVGDQREDGDPDKISEEHIRPIWKDDEEYTIHRDVDIAAAKAELQGSETGAHFGENYIYAEAVITATLYSREKFKGTGTPDFYCDPHLVNVMLLARDLNGRRIYDSKADLAKALNCGSIVEVEQFAGLTRTTQDGKQKKLLGLFVNLNDYTFGSTRGGEITKFEDFDMDFNLKKFMLETRLSGSLYKLKSAIALEEPVTA